MRKSEGPQLCTTFCFALNTQCINYETDKLTFVLFTASIRSKKQWYFVHDQGQKIQPKKIGKKHCHASQPFSLSYHDEAFSHLINSVEHRDFRVFTFVCGGRGVAVGRETIAVVHASLQGTE